MTNSFRCAVKVHLHDAICKGADKWESMSAKGLPWRKHCYKICTFHCIIRSSFVPNGKSQILAYICLSISLSIKKSRTYGTSDLSQMLSRSHDLLPPLWLSSGREFPWFGIVKATVTLRKIRWAKNEIVIEKFAKQWSLDGDSENIHFLCIDPVRLDQCGWHLQDKACYLHLTWPVLYICCRSEGSGGCARFI